MIKGVIFDMDGVLIDAREWHFEALNLALEPFGLAIPRDQHLLRFDGLSTKQKLEILSSETQLPSLLHDTISRVKQDRTLRIAAERCFPEVAHQILLSRLLKSGFKIGLYTNSIRKTTEFMLTYANLIQFIHVITTNEDVPKPKPAPDGYLQTCAALGLHPGEVIVIEDGEYGITAAKDAGCRVLKVEDPTDVNLELFLSLGIEEFNEL